MKYLILLILLSLYSAYPFDFGKYTVIDKATKDFLRAIRQKNSSDSSFNPGVLSMFGNSITIEDDFWTTIPRSSLGAVQGTLDSTYLREYKCAGRGWMLEAADMCVSIAVEEVKPEAVIMMFGTNEATASTANQVWDKWQSHYAALLDSLMTVGTIPIVSTIPPFFIAMDSAEIPMDSCTRGINDSLRSLAKQKHFVLVDYHQAFVDYTKGDIFNPKWWADEYLHPSGGCEPDTSNPNCGYGIRNAVCWTALNKVYRIIVDDGPPDTGATYVSVQHEPKAPTFSHSGFLSVVKAGTSKIKISFARQFRPQSIRLRNGYGELLGIRVSFNRSQAVISTETQPAGVYIIEALVNGKTYHRRILLP